MTKNTREYKNVLHIGNYFKIIPGVQPIIITALRSAYHTGTF